MRNEMASIKICLVKYLLPDSERSMQLQVFDLKTKFITSDKTLIRRLRGIVVHNVVKSKVENFLTFYSIYFI